MSRTRLRPRPSVALALALLLPACATAQRTTPAQTQAPSDTRSSSDRWLADCRERYDRDTEAFCEVRESTLPAGGRLQVDGRQNGGVRVTGWDRNEIKVIARIQANAQSEADARAMAREITIEARDGRVRAEGPGTRRREWWSVSYEVFVPKRQDLDLVAQNGGLSVEDVEGRLDLETVNGGISLVRVAGDVRGETTNGGVRVTLAGTSWRGAGLDVRTTNGGVSLTMPENYSARLETGTVNGSIRTDIPITVQGSLGRRLTTQLGSGGAPIRVTTTNGSVHLRRG